MSITHLPRLAQQPLHLFLVLDCSGSMASDGKIQALNVAIRETLPHLSDVDQSNPHARVLVRAVRFSTGASWHIREATPVDQLEWEDLTAGGYTDLGAALELIVPLLATPPMEPNALPPAIVLVSDGMPTDEFEPVLETLTATEWGRESLRVAVAIGREADRETLARFMDGASPVAASNPEQLADALRVATTRATVLASTLAHWVDPPSRGAPKAVDGDIEDVVW